MKNTRRGYLIVALVASSLALALLIVAATTEAAPATGNRGGCAEGNKIRGLACTVTDFRPGFVAGTCDGGFWFSAVRTARTWRLDQAVTVQGCIMARARLEGVAGWPLRISR
jgi:hypothetical protein